METIKEEQKKEEDLLVEAIATHNWSEVQKLCERHPKAARKWHLEIGFFHGSIDSDILPLHQLVASQYTPPLEVIEAVINAYPNALFAKEATLHRRALHLAALNTKASPGIIQMLLKHAPKMAMKRDSFGRLALHYACSSGADTEAVDALLNAYPESASAGDAHGWLPIHMACRRGASFPVIRRLVDAYPESIVAETNNGNTCVDMMLLQNVLGKQSAFLDDTSYMATEHWKENIESRG